MKLLGNVYSQSALAPSCLMENLLLYTVIPARSPRPSLRSLSSVLVWKLSSNSRRSNRASSPVSIQLPERDNSYTCTIQMLLLSWILTILHLFTFIQNTLRRAVLALHPVIRKTDTKDTFSYYLFKNHMYWYI